MALWDVVDVAADCNVALLHVEPPSVPPLQRSIQWYSDVLAHHPILELQIYATDHLGTTTAFLLQPEQVSKEVKVRKKPRYASPKWIKIEMCKMVFGWRLHRLITQNSNKSLRKG